MVRSGTINVLYVICMSCNVHVSVERGESQVQKWGPMISLGFRSGDLVQMRNYC